MNTILLFAAIGAVTLAFRCSFIVPQRQRGEGEPDRFESVRKFVPVAALTALVVPALAPRDGEPIYGRALAAALAAVVAYYSKNLLLTVLIGLGLLTLIV